MEGDGNVWHVVISGYNEAVDDASTSIVDLRKQMYPAGAIEAKPPKIKPVFPATLRGSWRCFLFTCLGIGKPDYWQISQGFILYPLKREHFCPRCLSDLRFDNGNNTWYCVECEGRMIEH